MDDTADSSVNPLLAPWTAPHGLPPYADIRPHHFEPAFEAAMAIHRDELRSIAQADALATFENTLAAFDRSGRLLAAVGAAFGTLVASAASDTLRAVQRRVAAPLAAHHAAVYTDSALFGRIDTVKRDAAAVAALTPEQRRLLERVHLAFRRNGAELPPAQRERLAAVMQRLATLTTAFAQNVLHDEEAFVLVLREEAELEGLPDFARAAMRQAAAERGHAGAHAVTLARALVLPFLAHSRRRDLREQVWRAWTARGESVGAHDNRPVIREILALRHEQATLLGYRSYADFALADTMAGSLGAVHELLDAVWPRALKALDGERALLRAAMVDAGVNPDAPEHRLEPWDWRWWAERVRAQRFAIDDAVLKAYLPLPAMVDAAFDCARRLFGVTFTARSDLPVYHPDVTAYEVHDADGRLRGLFLMDPYTRPGKRSGAWMSALRWQHRNTDDGTARLPVILNNNNVARGEGDQPALLSIEEVRTLFHELGHGLHGLLSDVTYERLSGTQVRRDFVELPSQIFEHWMEDPQVLKRHARHWQTGEPMPDALMDRLERARRFGQAYETLRYCGSALVDLALHARTEGTAPVDVCAFEEQVLAEAGLPHGVGINHQLVHFQHLFSSAAYAAGYYVYLWAEVLDADGFDAFVEAGDPFDPTVAAALRRCIYEAGDRVDPAEAFAAFRGRPPQVAPLLRQRGLVEAATTG
jgi:peptidyl-dipeptidase Dcp